jgi:hypothetical protein
MDDIEEAILFVEEAKLRSIMFHEFKNILQTKGAPEDQLEALTREFENDVRNNNMWEGKMNQARYSDLVSLPAVFYRQIRTYKATNNTRFKMFFNYV